ncbi:hypothetical protein K7432_015886 [Basidiobolus ranarum]|uniref:SF3 helicase domain-containing protein n=1 Tax=Basidiobolus ranarum TaxID=34480 RepID=A0ABR2WFP3_9FUNG
MKELLKSIDLAMEELLRQVRNIGMIQAALTPIEVIFTVATTLIDGPSSEGWLVIGNRYLNLETGKFHTPVPSLYISQVIQTPWEGQDSLEEDIDSTFPVLEPFLRELFSDRRENDYHEFIRNLQMFLGYSLTGKANLHTVVFLYGLGRNGKGLFCRLLKSVFIGEGNTSHKLLIDPAEVHRNASNIRDFLEMETIEQRLRESSPGHHTEGSIPENISNLITNLDKKIICKNARSAKNAHTAQLMGLIGARCVIFDELNAKEELDLAKFKQYTGGDAIVVRAAYNKDTFIIQKPMFTFLITTNVLPGIAPEPSVVLRIKVIQFNVFFDPLMKEDEVETRFRKRGNFEREDIIKSVAMRCDFLRWVVQGAFLFYKQKRIDWCNSIINDTNEFWGQSDIFKMFLEDYYNILTDTEQIISENIPQMIEQGYYIKCSDFERELASYYNEKQTPNNQIIPLQRVYQGLSNEYKIFKLRTARGGIKRAVYVFGLKRIIN